MTPTQLCCSQALSTDINEQVGPLMPNNLVTGRLKSLNIPEPQYRFIVVRMILQFLSVAVIFPSNSVTF